MGNEQCDDGNSVAFDGCFNCQFQCVSECLDCSYGICLECSVGFILDSNHTCQPICGDGIVIPYLEQCEDDSQGVICENCKFKCVDNCIECNLVTCFKCDVGFQLKVNQCIPICGDEIVIPNYEECDDGNQIQYDGCYECTYSCQQKCKKCEKGICLDQCDYGLVMVNFECQSICGNKIITDPEQCDDGNNIQYDGCYQCLHSCPLYCSDCDFGICNQCQEDYILLQNSCQILNQEICGNGIVKEQEVCDDGNTVPNDGCYQCNIEVNWICNDQNPSLCTFEVAPTIILKYIKETNFIQYVQLTFSQQVKLQEGQQLSEQVTMLNIPDGNFNITMNPITGITTNLQYVQYLIEIQINCQMSEKPILQIQINNVVNQYDIKLIQTTQQLNLIIPNFLSPAQKQTSQKLLQLNQNIIYSLAGISILSFISGESSLIQEVLNKLQYISLLKFLNINYPENLIIFFQFSDLVSVTPFLQFLNIDINFIQLEQDDSNQKGQFAYYNQQTNLITNLACQFLQMFGLLILYISLQIFQRLLFTDRVITKYFYCMAVFSQNSNNCFVMKMSNFLFKIIKLFFKTSYLLTAQGMKQIFLMNSWDLLFKIFLFLDAVQFKELQNYIELSISLMIGCIYLTILINLFQNSIYKRVQKQIFVRLLRQVLILVFLVFLQFSQVLQTLLISITNLFYVIILKYLKTNNIELVIEGAIVLFTFTSIFHFEDFEKHISGIQKVQIGFGQIGILASTLAIQLVNFIVTKGKLFMEQIKANRCQKKTEQT